MEGGARSESAACGQSRVAPLLEDSVAPMDDTRSSPGLLSSSRLPCALPVRSKGEGPGIRGPGLQGPEGGSLLRCCVET